MPTPAVPPCRGLFFVAHPCFYRSSHRVPPALTTPQHLPLSRPAVPTISLAPGTPTADRSRRSLRTSRGFPKVIRVIAGLKVRISTNRRTTSRIPCKQLTWPRANTWIIRLPRAVASTGPARAAGSVREELTQPRVPRLSPQDVYVLSASSGHLLGLIQDPAVLERQALERTPSNVTGRLDHEVLSPSN